jgi:hypothetical protein
MLGVGCLINGCVLHCRQRGVLLHVDACLGGFVLPFAKHLGYEVPAFDFSVPGGCGGTALCARWV